MKNRKPISTTVAIVAPMLLAAMAAHAGLEWLARGSFSIYAGYIYFFVTVGIIGMVPHGPATFGALIRQAKWWAIGTLVVTSPSLDAIYFAGAGLGILLAHTVLDLYVAREKSDPKVM